MKIAQNIKNIVELEEMKNKGMLDEQTYKYLRKNEKLSPQNQGYYLKYKN